MRTLKVAPLGRIGVRGVALAGAPPPKEVLADVTLPDVVVRPAAAMPLSVGVAVGATWVLHRELSGIREALSGHVAKNTAEHTTMGAEIIELKKRRVKR